jgi:hypothetical protein
MPSRRNGADATTTRRTTSLIEYASSPTPFWMVKLTDLGIVVAVATAIGIGLLRRAPWARRVMYPLLTGYTLLAMSVAGMAAVMNLHADPDASFGLAAGFVGFAAVFTVLTATLYRLLFANGTRHDRPGDPRRRRRRGGSADSRDERSSRSPHGQP